jgi:hypothetical protein
VGGGYDDVTEEGRVSKDLLQSALEALQAQELADECRTQYEDSPDASLSLLRRYNAKVSVADRLRRAVLARAAAEQADDWRSTVGMFDGDEDMRKVLRATDSPAAASDWLQEAARVQAAGGICNDDPWWDEFLQAIAERRAAEEEEGRG